MKKNLILLFLLSYSIIAESQTLFTPDGIVATSSNSNVGIGIGSPESKFHVSNGNFGVKSQYAIGIIESNDAHFDLISSSDATWGSSINLIEGNSTSNTDIWSIARQTTGGSGNSSLRFNFGTNNNHINSNKVTFDINGNVGIGTGSPSYLLHLKKSSGQSEFRAESSDHYAKIGASNAGGFIGASNATGELTVNIRGYGDAYFNAGNVGIGTTNPNGWKLAVKGKIRAEEIKVETGWSDFVFYENYDLRTLEEVEEHINENGHLPEIPSAAEVTENGIYLGEMNAKLLQKIEELTLYLIEQNKEIQELKKEVSALKNE